MSEPKPKRQLAKLLRRYKRFLADVELPGGEELTVHCPNPGRLLSVLEEGQPALIRDSENPKRKLRWTLEALKVHGTWVHVDTMASNGAVEAAILAGKIPELSGYEVLRREVYKIAFQRVSGKNTETARAPSETIQIREY